MANTNVMKRWRDDTTRVVADIHGVTDSYVRKVRAGERDDEEIITTSIEYQQGKSALIQHLKKLVPINQKRRSNGRKKN